MGLVYVYLLAWVTGGVLLGATMLLEQRDPAHDPASSPAPAPAPRLGSSVTFALIGFGLCGLAAEGLGLAVAPWTALYAAVGGLVLALLSYVFAGRLR